MQTSPGEGWIRLFDGSTRLGWVAETGEWKTGDAVLLSDVTRDSQIHTDTAFADYEIRFEARATGGAASLVFRVDPQSKPAQVGVRLSLADGSLDGARASALAAGAWHQYEIRADGTHITASVDGARTAQREDAKNSIGALQFEAPRGTRLEVRSIWLRPLNLTRIYNGSNLDGWRSVEASAPEKRGGRHLPIPGLSGKPKPPKAAHWGGNGVIRGDGGEGQLETSRAYDDFILHFTVKSQGSEKNGVAATRFLFRGKGSQYGSGYAVNTDFGTEKEDGKSFGPGSIVSLDKARTQPFGQGTFHTVTVVARGRRFAVWVDGSELADAYDSRSEGVYHAAAGPLAFILSSDRASLELRDVEASILAKGPLPAPAPVPIPVPPVVPTPGTSTAAAAPAPIILPGQSPEDKARAEQVRSLTTEALNSTSAEESLRINKQILVLDPANMPAQQRFDKAQAKVDATEALQAHSIELHMASDAKREENAARRDELMLQAQNALLHSRTNEAGDRLNDAQRLGANGPEFEHLQSIIHTRMRNRILFWSCLGGVTTLSGIFSIIYLLRGRRQILVAYLVAIDGPDKGRRYLLNQEITHLGGVAVDSGKKNEIIVRDLDRLVSRFHCEVHKRKNTCFAIDLDSSNGTLLNQRRLVAGAPTRMRDGDRLDLAGAATLQLHFERTRSR